MATEVIAGPAAPASPATSGGAGAAGAAAPGSPGGSPNQGTAGPDISGTAGVGSAGAGAAAADGAMGTPSSAPNQRAMVGLALAIATAVAGYLLLVVADEQGAPGWLQDFYLVAALAAIWLYVAFVYRPQLGLWDRLATIERRNRAVEEDLTLALDLLRSGDLVNSQAHSEALPPQLRAAFGGATAA
ncbi:MAG TPA: hypothetical protein VE075_01915, partial [Thermoanaerobaculia bacterium]|nr:hypothetical protein [Thermoanaerobaculia bacterium]